MKILLLVTCLVAISYADNLQMLKKFYDNYANCRNEVNVPQWTAEVIRCMFRTYELNYYLSLINKIVKNVKLANNIISNSNNVTELWYYDINETISELATLIDEHGAIIPDKLLKSYKDIISDEIKLNQAKEITSRCMEQAYESSGSNEEKVMTTIRCIMPIKDLFDKLQ